MTIGSPKRPPKLTGRPRNVFLRTTAAAACLVAITCLVFAPGCRRSQAMPDLQRPPPPVSVFAAQQRDVLLVAKVPQSSLAPIAAGQMPGNR